MRSSFAALTAHIDGAEDANGSTHSTRSAPEIGAANVQNPQDCAVRSNPETGAHLGSHLHSNRRAPIEECKMVRGQALRWPSDPSPTRTQRQLSRLTGIEESRLSRFLHCRSGRKTLPVDALDRLASATRLVLPFRVVR
jgi:hypothetical protein